MSAVCYILCGLLIFNFLNHIQEKWREKITYTPTYLVYVLVIYGEKKNNYPGEFTGIFFYFLLDFPEVTVTSGSNLTKPNFLKTHSSLILFK